MVHQVSSYNIYYLTYSYNQQDLQIWSHKLLRRDPQDKKRPD